MTAAKQGFALPAVLVMLAVLALVFLAALTGLQSLRSRTRSDLDSGRFEQQALTVEARVAYLAATRPFDATSIQAPPWRGSEAASAALQLDGRPYRASGAPGLWATVQDEAGLINLDQLPQPAAARLFARLQTQPDLEGELADRFADYVDPDQLKRAHGAERPDYLTAGLTPPPDRPLRRLAEVRGVLGWSERVTPQTWRAWRGVLTADPASVAVNVNTAPAEALEVLFGVTEAQARMAIARRAAQPFTSLEDFGRAVGIPLSGDAERVYTRPSGRLALQVGGPAGLEFHSRILFTPEDDERPIWFEERRTSAEPAGQGPVLPRDAPELPQPSP